MTPDFPHDLHERIGLPFDETYAAWEPTGAAYLTLNAVMGIMTAVEVKADWVSPGGFGDKGPTKAVLFLLDLPLLDRPRQLLGAIAPMGASELMPTLLVLTPALALALDSFPAAQQDRLLQSLRIARRLQPDGFALAPALEKVLDAPQRAMAARLAEYKSVQDTLPPAPARPDFDVRPLHQMPDGYVAEHFNLSMRSLGLLPSRLES